MHGSHCIRDEMSEYFIARQPIFDRKLNLYAYELLFRSSRTNSMPPDVDAEMATAQVLSTSSDIGLSELVGSDMAFINLPNRFLREPDLLPLPPGQVVLEILESVKIDAETLEGIRTLVERGFTLALDDFVYAERFEKVLPFVHIVKLEILAINEGEWAQQIRRLKAQDCSSHAWPNWAAITSRATFSRGPRWYPGAASRRTSWVCCNFFHVSMIPKRTSKP